MCACIHMRGWQAYERRRLYLLICSCRPRWQQVGALRVAAQLDGIVRNQAIYEKIVAEIRDAGYEHACSELQRKLET